MVHQSVAFLFLNERIETEIRNPNSFLVETAIQELI